MDDKIIIGRELFDEVFMFMSIAFLMHEDPSERFKNVMKQLDEINDDAGVNPPVLVPDGLE